MSVKFISGRQTAALMNFYRNILESEKYRVIIGYSVC